MNDSPFNESPFNAAVPRLDSADQRLVDAYTTIGRPVDDLPYTEDFEKLRRLMEMEDSNEARHFLFKRLLRLRKMGRLPRFSMLTG